MILDNRLANSHSKSRETLCSVKSVCLVLVFLSLISTANAIKCYVCGHNSDAPFYDANVNETIIKSILKSCDEFDRIPLDQKYKYEMECPEGHVGCMLTVGTRVMRSCSELRVDDCKTVNRVHYCYCHRPLCNGENAESIIEKLGDINDEDEEDKEEDVDSDDEASGDEDDEDLSHSSPRNFDSSERTSHEETSEENDVFVAAESSTTKSPTANKAVNSNLSRNLLVIALLVCSFINKHQN